MAVPDFDDKEGKIRLSKHKNCYAMGLKSSTVLSHLVWIITAKSLQ